MSSVGGTWAFDERDSHFDRVIEWLLIGLLAFMPLAFGAVQAWSEEVVVALAALLCICFFLKIAVARGSSVTWTWAYVPLLAFILVAAVQLVPLPISLVRILSPQTAARKLELLGDLSSLGSPPTRMTLSFYRHATVHDLRLVLAVASTFFVVLNTMRRPDQVTRVLWAITVIGAAVALEAIAQAVFGNGRIYWFVPSPHPTVLSGPFVNHSHYAQFMNLSIGAALGLALMTVHGRFAERSMTPAGVAEYLGSREGRRLIGLLLLAAIGAASVFASLSRGGMISMMVAGAFTIFALSSRKSLKSSGWVMAALALAAFICVLYIGFDAVYKRLGTLSDLNRAQGGRWEVVRNIAVAWTRFPLVGTGLGTHEVVYPMFDRATVPAIASHAENEYAQAAEEVGLAGLAALVAFGIVVWRSYARVVRSPRVAVHLAAYGLGFGLLAVMIHSLSDFGQHLPANAFLSAVFCAILIRLPRMGQDARGVDGARGDVILRASGKNFKEGILFRQIPPFGFGRNSQGIPRSRRAAKRREGEETNPPRRASPVFLLLPSMPSLKFFPEALSDRQARRFGLAGLAVACFLCAVGLSGADAARRAEAHWTKVLRAERTMIENDWRASDDEYVHLLSHATRAQECQPANITYRHWLNVYRWRTVSRMTDPNTGRVMLSAQPLEFVDRIADELKRTLLLCPTYGPAWTVCGQLEKFVLGRDEEGARHILRGRQLAPCDPATCFIAGLLFAENDDMAAAFREWQRAVTLDERLFPEVCPVLVDELSRPDLACELAQDDTRWLVHVEDALKDRAVQLEQRLFAQVSSWLGAILNRSFWTLSWVADEAPGLAEIRNTLTELGATAESLAGTTSRILALMQKECREPDTPAWKLIWMAKRYSEDGAADQAVRMYRRALLLEYGQVGWRLSLARSLVDQGMVSDAVRELQICLRLQPHLDGAERLLDGLSAPGNAGGGHL